jgi:hypothetical protein
VARAVVGTLSRSRVCGANKNKVYHMTRESHKM